MPDTPALINVLLPAVCNADDSSQAPPVNGVREGLTAFVLDIAGTALTKTTTAARREPGRQERAVLGRRRQRR